MRQVPISQAAGDLARLIREISKTGEEIVLTENSRGVARLVPEHGESDVAERLNDIYGCVEGAAADAWEKALSVTRSRQRLSDLSNPYAS